MRETRSSLARYTPLFFLLHVHFQTWAVIKVETCMDGYEEGDGSEREYGAQINLLLSETADHVIFRKERKKKGKDESNRRGRNEHAS